MSQAQSLEAILERQNRLEIQALKCGCCSKSMIPFGAEEKTRAIIELFKRPCQCHAQSKCLMCGWCLDHCKCGQRFVVD
jgi:hypothetical protein